MCIKLTLTCCDPTLTPLQVLLPRLHHVFRCAHCLRLPLCGPLGVGPTRVAWSWERGSIVWRGHAGLRGLRCGAHGAYSGFVSPAPRRAARVPAGAVLRAHSARGHVLHEQVARQGPFSVALMFTIRDFRTAAGGWHFRPRWRRDHRASQRPLRRRRQTARWLPRALRSAGVPRHLSAVVRLVSPGSLPQRWKSCES
jgi:hypothetical protein